MGGLYEQNHRIFSILHYYGFTLSTLAVYSSCNDYNDCEEQQLSELQTKRTMNSYDIIKNKRTGDRKLTILKNRLFKQQQLPSIKQSRPASFEREEIFTENNLFNAPKEEQSKLISHMEFKRSSSFVKFFISQLKKIRNDSKGDQRKAFTSKTREIQKMYEVSYVNQSVGRKGFVMSQFTQIIINILIVIIMFFLHFLSTFQFLFEDFRTLFDESDILNALLYVCIALTVIKIATSMIFVKIVMGKKLQEIEEIAYSYVTDVDFYLDILVLITGILLITFSKYPFAGIIGFIATIMNMAYIQRLDKNIVIIIVNNNTKKQIFALLKLILANFWIVHFIGTLLNGLALIENQRNWMDRYGISGQVWWVKYFYGTYWSVSIMSTVGFGDVVSSNIVEAIVLSFIILFGCLILSYNIAQVGSIFNNLVESPNQVKAQLSVLKRLAKETKLDPKLHHSIGEYIVHSAEIKRSFELKERAELIEMLPSQMKEQFLQYSSKKFCSTLPFFFMLQPETKRLAMAKIKLQVVSPNEFITHKKRGLTKIWILRKGVLGLAYKKKGSRLNGTILDTIKVNNQVDNPQLLNIYLLVRGKKLLYDIICQEYSVVGCLEFEDFSEALRESQSDFELFHQSRDEATFRINDWVTKKCDFCKLKHSLFVCPKIHYMPLRSVTFMKHQMRKSKYQKRSNFKYTREKNWIAKKSPMKIWKKMFVPIENIFDIKAQRNHVLRVKRTLSSDSQTNEAQTFQRSVFQQYFVKNSDKEVQFQLDLINDFKFYFHKHNAFNLVEKPVNKDMVPVMLERFRSVY